MSEYAGSHSKQTLQDLILLISFSTTCDKCKRSLRAGITAELVAYIARQQVAKQATQAPAGQPVASRWPSAGHPTWQQGSDRKSEATEGGMPNTITRGRPRQRGRPPKRQMGPPESGGPPVAPSGPQWPPSPHTGGYNYRGPGHYPYQQVIPRAEYSRGPNPYQQSVIRPRPSSAPSRAIMPDYQPITQPTADYRRFMSQQPRGAINQPSPILYQQLTTPLPTFSESFKEFMTHRAPLPPPPAVPGNPVQPSAVLPPPPPRPVHSYEGRMAGLGIFGGDPGHRG